MKLEIYNADKPETKPPVLLRLMQSGNDIVVVAVDADGDITAAGYLLRFRSDGSVHMSSGINATLGFNLDIAGCIKTI